MTPNTGPVSDIDLTPAQPRINARRIPELIDRYLSDVSRRNQQKTAAGYKARLAMFLAWWSEAGPERNYLLGADDLADYAAHLESLISQKTNRQIGYNSRNDALRRLSQCLSWAFHRGYVTIDLSLDVPAPTGSPPAKIPLELQTLSALLAAAATSSNPIRDSAIVAMLAGTGVRCEECAAMRIENVTLHADGSGYVVLRVAKNDAERTVAFDNATGAYIRRLLDKIDTDTGPLFVSRKASASLSPSGLYKIVVCLAEKAGVRDRITGPHDLRRMFATIWSRQLRGESYGQLLQTQLGHANWSTTARYSLQNAGDVLEVMRHAEISPIARLRTDDPNRASPFKK